LRETERDRDRDREFIMIMQRVCYDRPAREAGREAEGRGGEVRETLKGVFRRRRMNNSLLPNPSPFNITL
jgi:hypothetical protein